MHKQARDYVASRVEGRTFGTVVEFGGRYINGTVRDLFDCDTYLSVDIRDGDGVDVVADAETWAPDEPVDAVVCCEVFEHTEGWPAIVANAASILTPDGVLIVTCATDGRPPHSAYDGGTIRDGEWYENVERDELVAAVEEAGFTVTDVHVNRRPADLYLEAVKGG